MSEELRPLFVVIQGGIDEEGHNNNFSSSADIYQVSSDDVRFVSFFLLVFPVRELLFSLSKNDVPFWSAAYKEGKISQNLMVENEDYFTQKCRTVRE